MTEKERGGRIMFFIEAEDMKVREKEKESYKKLKSCYNQIENISVLRTGDRNEALTKCNKYIAELRELFYKLESEECKKLAILVKGTTLFRRAQILDRGFERSRPGYQEAYALLEKAYITDSYDFLNELLLLNLSKCLRNMGIRGHKNDYELAMARFDELQKKIEEGIEIDNENRKMERWETSLWIEAKINKGIINKYLYKIEDAKSNLWEILNILLKKKVKGWETVSDKLQQDNLLNKDRKRKVTNESLKIMAKLSDNKIKYEEYMQQVLVELGTVYLRGRYLEAAKNLFVITYNLKNDNIDALNNIGVYLYKRNLKGDYEKAIRIFMPQAKKGNRFALINIYKCQIALLDESEMRGWEVKWEQKMNPASDKDIEKILELCEKSKLNGVCGQDIEKELKDNIKYNRDDLEMKLLLGLCYKKKGKWKEAYKEFEEIYHKYPYIHKGSIGLKAYSNMMQYEIEQRNFYKAKAGLDLVRLECQRDKEDDTIDFLAEMELGWCLLNIDHYEEAKVCFENVLQNEKEKQNQDERYSEKRWNVIRARNNLGLCYLYLGQVEEAFKQFEEVIRLEPDNVYANYCLARCYSVLAKKGEEYIAENKSWEGSDDLIEEKIKENLKSAVEKYEAAIFKDEKKEIANLDEKLLIAQIKACKDRYGKDSDLAAVIEGELRNQGKTYQMETSLALVNYIERATEKEKDILYKSFAQIQIEAEDEAYLPFKYFLKEQSYRRLPESIKGEMFARMLKIYECILEIKKVCHYTVGQVPLIHYTTLKTLKILLDDYESEKGKVLPRLRLWNTVYMNDSYEGEAFIGLLKEVSGCGKDETEEIISKYFKHLSNSSERLVPINGNVYLISFSMRKDSIPMWNAYAEDAKGCFIEFQEDFFDNRKKRNVYTDIASDCNVSYPLYKVIYINSKEDNANKGGKEDTELSKVKKYIGEIWRLLKEFEDFWKDGGIELGNQIKEVSRKYIADCLNEVRFLFKYSEYSHEEEVRLVKCSYTPELDKENFSVPRLYIESDKEIDKMVEVCLGKKISQSDINQIVSWLHATKRVENVTVSSRHYQ